MTNTSTLVFTGDISFDRYMDGKWEDENLLSSDIYDFFASANHVVANIEGPLVAQETNTSTNGVAQLMHTMDPAVTGVLRRMGADVWNLCNNHIMDAGAMGLASTLREAANCDAATIGAGMNLDEAKKPLILDEAGGIGLLAVGYQRGCKPAGDDKAGCLSWSDMETIQETIDDVKQRCRWCVVVSHGGEEFTSLPSPYTRDRYHAYLDMGADLVVSHHPHVPMNYELVGDKAIFYSLGNFIFDTDYQRAQFNTDIGILLKLSFTPERFTFEPMGIKILRDTGRIVQTDIPRIFCDVPEKEYTLLAPLAAKMFLAATKRQQIYLNPEKFTGISEDEWEEHFLQPKRSGRVPGEALDFHIVYPLAQEESKKAWQHSTLDDVKDYILEQM